MQAPYLASVQFSLAAAPWAGRLRSLERPPYSYASIGGHEHIKFLSP
jgi:hypothetical protein